MPIIVITPKLRAAEKVALFHAGANACLERPVDAALCVAQARSLVQLYSDAKLADKKVHPLVFGTELIINPVYRHVIIDGEPLELTRTEFDLLYYMAEHPNQIFSRQQLYQQVWGDDLGISGENTVRSHIGNIYKKLADVDKHYIQNTRGIGYKFVPPTGEE
nr:response regulator transcription factor [Parablautia muri]